MDHNATTIKPFLTVSNGKKAVDFYIAAFGATETKRFEVPDQKISSSFSVD